MKNQFTTSMMQDAFKNIPWSDLKADAGIFEFFEEGENSIGISYETMPDGSLAYIFNLFIRGEYINIPNEYERPEDAIEIVTAEWNRWREKTYDNNQAE